MHSDKATRDFALPTIAGLVRAIDIMTPTVVTARRDLPTREVVDRLVDRQIGCLPVVDGDGWPIGVITLRDIVIPLANHVATADEAPAWSDLSPQTAEELMLPLAITLNHHATIAQAAALMVLEGVHHLPVVDGSGRIVGILSTLDIVRWLAQNDGMLDTSHSR